MIEYHIFPTSPDALHWKASFRVHAVSDEAVCSAFPGVDRIYRFDGLCPGGLVRIA